MLSRRALVLTVVSIGIGVLATIASYVLSRDHAIDFASYLRYATVLTLAVYVAVGLLLVTQVTPSIRLRWCEGRRLTAVGLGLATGVVPSLLLLAAVSSAAGHLAPDPRAVVMMGEGDVPHVVAALLIFCVAAPLVEEVLFRGVLLESLRRHGNAGAIWLSATAFAVWHLHPVALYYYALMGAVLGWLYVKRGLLCSMAAHLGFNGVLTVAALVVVFGGGGTATADGLTVTYPHGWSMQSATSLPAFADGARPSIVLHGPAGASVVVIAIPTPLAPGVQRLEDTLSSPSYAQRFPGAEVGTIREVHVPVGTVVEVDAIADGERGTLALVPHAGTSYELVFRGAGSARALADFPRIVAALRVS